MKKRCTAQQKAQIVLEMLKEERPITQIASEYGIHPNQLYKWKTQALEGLPKLFDDEGKTKKALKAAHEQELQELYAEIGRLTTGLTYSYGDAAHRHAVTALSNGASFGYDANGNMTRRNLPGQNYSLAYDGENHLTAVSGAATANYTYDGDGQRVIAAEGAATTVFIGNYFEWQAGNSTKYYYAGATRVALRQGANPPQFLLGDHLGSTTRTASAAGATSGMQLYRPWGEMHHTSGSLLTQYQYTGQWQSASGLYYYGARWYDGALGRFVQPDTLIPDPYNTLDWDRYSYARYNPMKYIDPSGHKACSESGDTPDDCKDPLGITADEFGKKYGVDFRGRWPTENLKWRAILATIFVGRALKDATSATTAVGAFSAVYGSVTFTWGPCPSCGGAFGYTYSAHSIEFRGMYQNSILAIRNIIHELGHAFDHGVCEARTNGCISPDNVWNSGVRSDLIGMMGLCSNGPNCLGRNGHSNLTGGFWGFAKDWGEWQFGASNEPGEIWADMFLGWVFSAWETSPRGTIREAYMNQQMPGYVDLFLGY